MEKADDIIKASATLSKLQGQGTDLVVSKRQLGRIEAISMARMGDGPLKQELVYSSRPFVLCGLPVKRPKKDVLKHERRNGKFVLQITGHPDYGLPFGQDRLIPIWVATLALRRQHRFISFKSAAEILETFGLPKDGPHYRRLVHGFERIFGATIFFGTDEQRRYGFVHSYARFHFFDRMDVWYTKQLEQQQLPTEDFQNQILLRRLLCFRIQVVKFRIDPPRPSDDLIRPNLISNVEVTSERLHPKRTVCRPALD